MVSLECFLYDFLNMFAYTLFKLKEKILSEVEDYAVCCGPLPKSSINCHHLIRNILHIHTVYAHTGAVEQVKE